MAAKEERSAGWFFDRPFVGGQEGRLAEELTAWLRSEPLRWLLEHLSPGSPPGGARAGLDPTLAELGEVCDWARPGTVWDYRKNGERLLDEDPASAPAGLRDEVAKRATALGLRSQGSPRSDPSTFVVLGGRRLAPLNRARAAARAIRRQSHFPAQVVMLCGRRSLEPAEQESEEVRGYASGAQTERELMVAAAERAFAAVPAEVRILEVPDPPAGGRASTFETLRAIAADSEAGEGPLAIVTSPTCRPFQYLEAVRAVGIPSGRSCELIAHAPAAIAEPHVYLQEIRSVIQAAGRLAGALSAARAAA